MNDYTELLSDISKLRNFTQVYQNSTPIVYVGDVPLLMHELALAGLQIPVNMVFIGRSGPGKSQLISEIRYGIMNGEAVHLRGSADLKVKPTYCTIDMELYKQGRVDEAVKPRANASKMLHIMEEFNRTVPVVANDWLAIADGVVPVDGDEIPLGVSGFRVAIGAANVGNGEFVGTFQSDNALKERLVWALDFDGENKPRELDYFDIFEASSDPRVVAPPKKDQKELLVKVSKQVDEFARSVDYLVRMMQIYLVKGIDEVVLGQKEHSKEEVLNLGSAVEKDSKAKNDLLNYVTAPSVRAVKVFGAVVPSLALIALSKGAKSDNIMMDASYAALQMILPFSDSLPKKILANNRGSRRAAAREIVELVKKDMPGSELLMEGLQKAADGKLQDKDTSQFEAPRIRCFGRFMKQLNERALKEKAEAKKQKVK